MKPDIESESRFLPIPHVHSTPPLRGGGFRQNIAITFGTEKLEWCGYPKVKKMKIYLFVLTECSNVTDIHGQTDGQTPYDG